MTCVAAVATYALAGRTTDRVLAAPAVGVALSTPVAALIVKMLEAKLLKLINGVFTLVLGTITIFKTMRVL